MQLTKFTSLLGMASLAIAENTLTFLSQDPLDRHIYFDHNPGHEDIHPLAVPGTHNVTIDIPHGWTGNFFSVLDGAPIVTGMLGEVAYNGWDGQTYFDVSAIVNPNDKVGVKQMWPAGARDPISGCEFFPCNFAYYLPNDEQTRTTRETDLYVSLGTANYTLSRRDAGESADSRFFSRDYVVGKWSAKRQ
jgi:hypothetical protein